MTQASTGACRAFAVWWKDLDRWSVASQRGSSWQWPPAAIKTLASALERRYEPVDKDTFELKPEHFLSLRFTGEIEPRDLHGKVDFKGALFFAHAGDIIYSKIDVRNGAIGIIPPQVPVATVTSEFPVYRIKKNIALSEYIQLVFRTSASSR
jgi:type I restriction enzyme, S subunit